MTTLTLDTEIPVRPTPSFVSAPPSLNDLAIRYGTDKRIGIHSYVKWYEALCAPRRWQQLTMLEIGVQTGASIKMWADYFPNAQLVGIDIDPRCAQFATNRIQIITGGQENPEIAKWLAGAYPDGLDIVIDDGSHLSADVILSFRTLFPLLRPGGLYVIEDLQTSYWPGWNGGTTDLDEPGTSLGFLKTLVDSLHHQEHTGRTSSAQDRMIGGLHFYHNIAFIEKSVNAEQASAAWIPRDLHPRAWMYPPATSEEGTK